VRRLHAGRAEPDDPLGRDSVRGLLDESVTLFGQQRYEEARRVLQTVLTLDPRNAAAFNNLGSVAMVLGEWDRARDSFHRALELEPGHGEAAENLRRLSQVGAPAPHEPTVLEVLEQECLRACQEKRFPDAIRGYFSIVEVDPVNVKAWNNLAILHYQLSDFARAEELFHKALELYFIHGIVFDERYAVIKENLRKLRAMRQEQGGEALRGALLREVQQHLYPLEQIVDCAAGNVVVPLEGSAVESSAIVAASSLRVIILARSPLLQNQPQRLEMITYGDVRQVRVYGGIQRATLSIKTDAFERRITSSNRNELQSLANSIQETIRRAPTEQQKSEQATQEATAVRLLEALREMNIYTEEEIREKLRKFETSGPPPRLDV
jgi:tetratricopeptide (TPR) repeat protein